MDNRVASERLTALSNLFLDKYRNLVGASYSDSESLESIIEATDNYYEEIISCMPGNVYWLDRNGVAVGCNKNVIDMFGLKSIKQFKGLNFEAMAKLGNWQPLATQSFKKDTLEVIRTSKPKLNIEELPIPHPDGYLIYFLTNRVPLFDNKGHVIGVVGISVDITDRKKMEFELKAEKERAELASKTKSEFIANMSHDVKTPLSGIIGTMELLIKQLEKKQDIDPAQSILMASHQLMAFFENCLEVARSENREIIFIEDRFSLRGLLSQISALFEPAIRSKGLSFNVEYLDNVSDFFIGSSAAIYRILLNLVGNAVKFTQQGSVRVLIRCSEKSSSKKTAVIRFIVEDTGVGIPLEKQKIIFEQYTRLFPSYESIYEGTGIGLYLVKKFVKAIGGEIYVKSEEGKGSRFTVLLPLEIPLLQPEEYEEKKDFLQIPVALSNYIEKKDLDVKILFVEDNRMAQKIGESILTSLGCHVDVADCGEKALALFEAGKYHLIFMDIGLPDMSGYIVTQRIREAEKIKACHVPIIALTAHAKEDVHEKSIHVGIEEIISKPLTEEQANKIVQSYVINRDISQIFLAKSERVSASQP